MSDRVTLEMIGQAAVEMQRAQLLRFSLGGGKKLESAMHAWYVASDKLSNLADAYLAQLEQPPREDDDNFDAQFKWLVDRARTKLPLLEGDMENHMKWARELGRREGIAEQYRKQPPHEEVKP